MKYRQSTTAVSAADRAEKVANPGFGKYYTDHMVICEWNEATGWDEPELIPYGYFAQLPMQIASPVALIV